MPNAHRNTSQARTWAQERRAAGLCNKCSNPAMPGRSRCMDCWQRGKANKQRAYQRRKAGQVRQTCVSRIINGQSRYPNCQQKATDARRSHRRK